MRGSAEAAKRQLTAALTAATPRTGRQQSELRHVMPDAVEPCQLPVRMPVLSDCIQCRGLHCADRNTVVDKAATCWAFVLGACRSQGETLHKRTTLPAGPARIGLSEGRLQTRVKQIGVHHHPFNWATPSVISHKPICQRLILRRERAPGGSAS